MGWLLVYAAALGGSLFYLAHLLVTVAAEVL
jgi:hypothetical protein